MTHSNRAFATSMVIAFGVLFGISWPLVALSQVPHPKYEMTVFVSPTDSTPHFRFYSSWDGERQPVRVGSFTVVPCDVRSDGEDQVLWMTHRSNGFLRESHVTGLRYGSTPPGWKDDWPLRPLPLETCILAKGIMPGGVATLRFILSKGGQLQLLCPPDEPNCQKHRNRRTL